MSTQPAAFPAPAFRFQVDFRSDCIDPGAPPPSGPVTLCQGAFSEVTGLEATMEPKAIQEGGRNYGAIQRNGPVYFSTVIMKRGMTTSRDLWLWFFLVNGGLFSIRLAVTITMFDTSGEAVVAWELAKALPSSSRRLI